MPKDKLFDTEVALEKAMHLFWRKGYNGTSINNLVDATGLSRSSLYATYQDKHQLYLASLKHYQRLNTKWLMEELNKHSSARKKIEVIFRATMNTMMKDTYGKGCFMINTATEMANQSEELAKMASDDFSGMEELFLQIIKQGQAEGEIDKQQKAKALAHYFFTSYLGLRVMGQTNPDKSKLEDSIRITLNTLD